MSLPTYCLPQGHPMHRPPPSSKYMMKTDLLDMTWITKLHLPCNRMPLHTHQVGMSMMKTDLLSHIRHGQGQILALAYRFRSSTYFKLFPLRSEAAQAERGCAGCGAGSLSLAQSFSPHQRRCAQARFRSKIDELYRTPGMST